MENERTDLSVIVPAFDEERWIGATLEALREALLGLDVRSEVIVVDDASADGTVAVAEGRGARVVRVNHRQIAATRNSGAAVARGRFLVFVDADTRVDRRVMAAALQAMRRGAVGGGAAVRFDEPLPRWARWLLPVLTRAYRAARLAPGCFFFARREDFEAVGGFDERYFGGEEVQLSLALRRRGRFALLRDPVLSSSRKLRAHSAGELLRLVFRLLVGGRRAVRRRRGMDLWYGERREDPAGVAGEVRQEESPRGRVASAEEAR